MRTELDPKVYAETYNLMCVYVLYLDKVYSLAWSKAVATQTAQAPAAPNGTAAAAPAAATAANTTVAANTAAPTASATPSATEPHLQQSPPPAEGTPTNPVFRTTTRLVQVDVVVTDKQGRPIPGLKQSDFTVMQDGKPQQIHVFEPHGGSAGAQAVAGSDTPKLAPNTYSNHPAAATADSWTIVLYDLLNTPTSDQEYSRK
jgi:hypothetical protein